MASYIPSTAEERKKMLVDIGVSDIDELFADIPKGVRLSRPLNIPEGKSEFETARIISDMAAKNTVYKTILRGAGAYSHFIPSVVRHIASREEFVSAYTPYQAEISQGVLQAIFEYQTMISELCGMDVSNASVYDGATAAAEAVAMCRDRGKTKVVLSEGINPYYSDVIKTYGAPHIPEVVSLPLKDGAADIDALADIIDSATACVVVQYPNYFGIFEDLQTLADAAHAADAKLVVICNPIALGLLKSPGECGADIAVGEAQPLGMPLAFGGPYLGFMTCKKEHSRKLPGRIAGETVDLEGKRGFVLTMQAREQHIRREKASSSICSNQALCALTASAYMAAMGPRGVCEVAAQCYDKAHYAAERISGVKGFELVHKNDFFHEFLTTSPVCRIKLNEALAEAGILGPQPVDYDGRRCLLWCVTERNTKQEIDLLCSILERVVSE